MDPIILEQMSKERLLTARHCSGAGERAVNKREKLFFCPNGSHFFLVKVYNQQNSKMIIF